MILARVSPGGSAESADVGDPWIDCLLDLVVHLKICRGEEMIMGQ